ncbi:MAG TPA: penicillin-binding transpeptidase domain-containing protein [Vicinamibacterales bacterium]|nr:penicillin-binding transpeptidase domain-containing protein [Vicinamibacterales bacterium]
MSRVIIAGVLCALQSVSHQALPRHGACAIVYEIGVGEVLRRPASSCGLRVTPQSTFKIPHAIAALDARVLDGADETIKYDGRPVDSPFWRQDHTLATAIRYSVVWYFQEIAKRLGATRERDYLERFEYGNRDPSSGLTTFWLGGSLVISPDEQEQFLLKLYSDRLPVRADALATVRRLLVQPAGAITNATGEHPFGGRWPKGTVLSAKTGSGDTAEGRAVRWLVGHVRQGSRAWVFVSNVVGDVQTPALAAVDQAEHALVDAGILRP